MVSSLILSRHMASVLAAWSIAMRVMMLSNFTASLTSVATVGMDVCPRLASCSTRKKTMRMKGMFIITTTLTATATARSPTQASMWTSL